MEPIEANRLYRLQFLANLDQAKGNFKRLRIW